MSAALKRSIRTETSLYVGFFEPSQHIARRSRNSYLFGYVVASHYRAACRWYTRPTFVSARRRAEEATRANFGSASAKDRPAGPRVIALEQDPRIGVDFYGFTRRREAAVALGLIPESANPQSDTFRKSTSTIFR